jgi:hypothetical protein
MHWRRSIQLTILELGNLATTSQIDSTSMRIARLRLGGGSGVDMAE